MGFYNSATFETMTVNEVGSMQTVGSLSSYTIEPSPVHFVLPKSSAQTTIVSFDSLFEDYSGVSLDSADGGPLNSTVLDSNVSQTTVKPTDALLDPNSSKNSKNNYGQQNMKGGNSGGSGVLPSSSAGGAIGGGAMNSTGGITTTSISSAGFSGSSGMGGSTGGEVGSGDKIGGKSANGTDGRVVNETTTSYNQNYVSVNQTQLSRDSLLDLADDLFSGGELYRETFGSMSDNEKLLSLFNYPVPESIDGNDYYTFYQQLKNSTLDSSLSDKLTVQSSTIQLANNHLESIGMLQMNLGSMPSAYALYSKSLGVHRFNNHTEYSQFLKDNNIGQEDL